MNWISEMSFFPVINGTISNGISDEKLEIKRVHIDNEVNEITIIAEFFIAQHTLFDLPLVTAIPITNVEVEEIVMEQIAIHFNKIQKIFINDSLERIQMMEIKEISKKKYLEMVQTNKVHPIIKEIYFSSDITPLEHNHLTFREYKKRYVIINEKIEIPTKVDSSFLEVINFIKKSFGVSKDNDHTFVILPTGWILRNEMKNLKSIKVLNQYFNLELIVDTEVGQILSIDLSNR